MQYPNQTVDVEPRLEFEIRHWVSNKIANWLKFSCPPNVCQHNHDFFLRIYRWLRSRVKGFVSANLLESYHQLICARFEEAFHNFSHVIFVSQASFRDPLQDNKMVNR